jgi:hypothetical protein
MAFCSIIDEVFIDEMIEINRTLRGRTKEQEHFLKVEERSYG